jgi:hypothetical protein
VNRAESIRRWQSRSQSNWRPSAGQHQFIAAKCPIFAIRFVAIFAVVGQYMSKSVRISPGLSLLFVASASLGRPDESPRPVMCSPSAARSAPERSHHTAAVAAVADSAADG